MQWILALSYWVHLLATVVWLGGIALLTLFAWPALQRETVTDNQWWSLQKSFIPWANASMIVLLISGFYQMTNDANYAGFLNLNSQWAAALLLKHIAFLSMIALTVYMQAILYPAMSRLSLAAESDPERASAERGQLQLREIRLLRLNLALAVIVLLFTAVATSL